MTGQGGEGGNDLTKLTVNLSSAAWSALEESARLTDLPRTDVVNVAVMLFQQLAQYAIQHEGVYRASWPDVCGRTLYLKVSREPWQRWTQ